MVVPRFPVSFCAPIDKDLEIRLRSQCEKIRVVEKLNGSHLLFPQTPLAVRIYYPADIQRFEERLNQKKHSSAESIHQVLERWHAGNENEDFDNLRDFLDKNGSTVIICVLPQDSIDQFDNPDSFMHRVQRIVRGGSKDQVSTRPPSDSVWRALRFCCSHNIPSMLYDNNIKKHARVIVVADTQGAIDSLYAMLEALGPVKRRLQQEYFERQRATFYIPDESGLVPKDHKAAEAVSRVLNGWANEYHLPESEQSVLMSYIGTLAGIATADDNKLHRIPVVAETRSLLQTFFGSKGSVTAGGMNYNGVNGEHHFGNSATLMQNQNARIPEVVQVPRKAMVTEPLDHGSDIGSPIPPMRTLTGASNGLDRQYAPYPNQSGDPHHVAALGPPLASFHNRNSNQMLHHPEAAQMGPGQHYETVDAGYGFQHPSSSFQFQQSHAKLNSAFQNAPPPAGHASSRFPPLRQELGQRPVVFAQSTRGLIGGFQQQYDPQAYGQDPHQFYDAPRNQYQPRPGQHQFLPAGQHQTAPAPQYNHSIGQHQPAPAPQYHYDPALYQATHQYQYPHQHQQLYEGQQFYGAQRSNVAPTGVPQPHRRLVGLRPNQEQQPKQPAAQSSKPMYGRPKVPTNPDFHRGIRRFA
jgi:hypothetical protein